MENVIMENGFNDVLGLVERGVSDGVYPGAAVSVGDRHGEIVRAHRGYSALFPEREPLAPDTLFDLASLTKIMSTLMVALKLMEANKLKLSDTLGMFFDAPLDKRAITVFDLLTHTGGFAAHARLEKIAGSPSGVPAVILNMPLSGPVGAQVIYSCLGFILLGKICEITGGAGLDSLAETLVFEPLGMKSAAYMPAGRPPPLKQSAFAATEYDETRGEYIRGAVHDEKARFLNGVSGNAGLFADIGDCALFARMLAGRGGVDGKIFIPPDLFSEAVKDHTPNLNESRGLGFALKGRTPVSCGALFSRGSYGHTGFTGTSVWVDAETSLYVVFLTNRVHPSRNNERLLAFRSVLHDCCARAYCSRQ